MRGREKHLLGLQELAEELVNRLGSDEEQLQPALLSLTIDPGVVAERLGLSLHPAEISRVRKRHGMRPLSATELANALLDGTRAMPPGLKLRVNAGHSAESRAKASK